MTSKGMRFTRQIQFHEQRHNAPSATTASQNPRPDGRGAARSPSKSAEIAHRSLRLGGPNSVLGPRLVQKDGIAYDRERMAANLWEQRRFPDVSPVGTNQMLRLVSKIQTCAMGEMQFARLVSLPCVRGTMDRAYAVVEAHAGRGAAGISIGAPDRCS